MSRDSKKAKKKPIAATPIEYPTWVVKSSPTPADRLVICDHCREARWTIHGTRSPIVHWCDDQKRRRMREATWAEVQEARKAINHVIGA